MKPKPFASLNHLTVPCSISDAPLMLLPRTQCGSAACGAVTRNRQELLIEFWDCKECSMAGENFVPHPGNRVLVINPGSTSTKFGVFTMECAEWVSSVHHGDEELSQFRGRSMLARTGYRAALIERALVAAGYDPKHFAAVG